MSLSESFIFAWNFTWNIMKYWTIAIALTCLLLLTIFICSEILAGEKK